MNMKLSKIIIAKAFKENPPAEQKLDNCRTYFKDNGKLDRDIVVSHDNVLIDGYVGYLVLMENGIKEANVHITDIALYKQSKSYHNSETVYVYGRHSGKQGEYVWRISPQTKNVDLLKVGGRAMVKTKYGNRVVTVTNVRTLKEPPVKGDVKKVVRCLSDCEED